jgi:hypothetical protein
VPTEHGVWRHDDQGLAPPCPHPGVGNPKESVARMQLRPLERLLVDGELLAQGEVLEGEVALTAAKDREESE